MNTLIYGWFFLTIAMLILHLYRFFFINRKSADRNRRQYAGNSAITEQHVLAAAKSAAELDGNPFSTLARNTQHRYLDRARKSLEAAENAEMILPVPDGDALSAPPPEGYVLVPVNPSPGLLMSMAIRYDHGLGCPGHYDMSFGGGEPVSHAKRLETTLTQMRQLHEEVVGTGFYDPKLEADYVKRGETSRPTQPGVATST